MTIASMRRMPPERMDAAVPVDAQNAPTGTWKLQNSFHSANSAHPLFEKDLNPNRREPEVSTLSWDFTLKACTTYAGSRARPGGAAAFDDRGAAGTGSGHQNRLAFG